MGALKTEMFELHTLNDFVSLLLGFTIEANNDLIPGNGSKLVFILISANITPCLKKTVK